MNDEERIISPDDVFNQQIQDQEEISPYVNEPVREKLTVSDLTKGLKNFLNPERPDEETLEKRRKEFQFKKDLIGGDSNFLAGPASPLFNFILKETNLESSKKLAEQERLKNPDIIKISDTKYINTTTGKNIIKSGSNELTEQAFNGLLEAGYSLGQLITIPLDLGFDTDLTSKIDKLYDDLKYEDPDTFYEQATKTLVEYGVPFGIINKFAKPIKTALRAKASKIGNKTARYGTKAATSVGFHAGSFGVAEFIVGNKGDTINDVKFEGEEGLKGRDLAIARLNNKIRFGIEGAKIGTAFGLVGRAAPIGIKYGLKATGIAANFGARTANKLVFNPLSKVITKIDPGIQPTLAKAIRNGSVYTVNKLTSPLVRGLSTETKKGIAIAGGVGAIAGLGAEKIDPSLGIGLGTGLVTSAAVYAATKGKFKYEGKLPPFEEWRLFSATDANPLRARLKKIDNFVSYFRKEYRTPDALYNAEEAALLKIKSENRVIAKYLEDLEKRTYDLAKAQTNLYNKTTSSPMTQNNYLDLIEQYLKNQIKIDKLPTELKSSAEGLKKYFDNIKSEFLNSLPKGDLKNDFAKNIKSYLRKSYAVISDPLYNPPRDVMDAATKAGVKIIKKNKDLQEEAVNMFPKMKKEEAYSNFSNAMMQNIIQRFKTEHTDPVRLINEVSKKILNSDKAIMTGEELPVFFRKLLGEEKNLSSSVFQTVTDLVTQTANKKMYDEIADIGLKSGWLKPSIGRLETNYQKIGKIPGLGLLDSRIKGLFANREVALSIEGSKGVIDSLMQNDIYRGLMQYKTAVQLGKTALSPETQVRNVVSTPVFPLSYGWVGGSGTINDSFKVVYDDIYGAGKKFNTPAFIEDIGKKIKLGVLDESVEVQEMLGIIKKIQNSKKNNLDSFLQSMLKTDIGRKSTQTYQAGDNVWKDYSFKWNQGHLSSLFKGDLKELIKQEELITGRKYNTISKITGKTKTYDDAVDELSAWYVRTHMPTYSQIPPVVAAIRGLPIGSFISWPSEVLRLSGAAIRTSLRESSSDNVLVRQMGLRKLMGIATTMGGAGYVIDKVAQNYTGVTQDMMDAYKRSFAAVYNKNSNLAPATPVKDGIFKFINSSYADVFDFIKKPIRSSLEQLGKIKDPKDIDDFVAKAIFSAVGDIVEPFITTTLGLEPVLDVTPTKYGGRGGRTKLGSRVYSDTDDSDTVTKKSISHILSSVFPGFVVSFDKYGNIAYDYYTNRGQPNKAVDTFLSLISGNKIQRVDLYSELDRKVGQFGPKLKGELTASESFYSDKDWQSRGPKVIGEELKQIQKESFKVQQELLQIVEDAKTLGIPLYRIEKILSDRLTKEVASNVLYSKQFVPYKHYSNLFEKRYENISRQEKLAGRPNPNYNYVYPIGEIVKVESDHIGLDLRKDYDEQMKQKEERRLKLLKGDQSFVPTSEPNVQLVETPVKVQTPELPKQPQPVINPQPNQISKTGLTQTEMALLSPSEQAIRLKQRGATV
jgi:hypothetical protein